MDRGTRGGDGVRRFVGLCSNRVCDAKLDVLGAIGRNMPGEIRSAHHVRHLLRQGHAAAGIGCANISNRHGPDDGDSSLDKVQSEVGYDTLLPSSNPVFFLLNGKLCTPESSLFKGSPAIGGGIYNVGFKKNVTNYNILYVMAQKTLPFGGYLSAGLYHGTNDVLFTNSDGNIAKTGAKCVANGNPGCSVQLEAGVRAKGSDVEIAHPVTLLARAYRKRK